MLYTERCPEWYYLSSFVLECRARSGAAVCAQVQPDRSWFCHGGPLSTCVAAEQQAEHEYRQEQERETSVMTGRPAWAMTVELPSRRDAVALAGQLAAQGWQVRRLGKDLIVWADCEDDAEGLDRALSGDAYTAFRVRRVSYGRNIPPGPPPQGPLIFGP